MLPEFYMVLESANNRGAKEVTLPAGLANDLAKHIELLESQLLKLQDEKRAAGKTINMSINVSADSSDIVKTLDDRDAALDLVAQLKVVHALGSYEIGMAAARFAVHKGN